MVAAILIAAGLWFFFPASTRAPQVTNYPSSGTDVIAFGDSLVAGSGAASGSDFVSLLSKKVGQPIVNLGVPGNTTAQGLARLSELDAYHPKVVLLLLGGNDHLARLPIEETFSNLGKIIENIQGRGSIVLLLGVRGNLLGDKFRPEFEKLQAKYKTAYVPDVLSGLFGNGKYMSDTIHPNDEGYAIIAERIYPVLSKLLE